MLVRFHGQIFWTHTDVNIIVVRKWILVHIPIHWHSWCKTSTFRSISFCNKHYHNSTKRHIELKEIENMHICNMVYPGLLPRSSQVCHNHRIIDGELPSQHRLHCTSRQYLRGSWDRCISNFQFQKSLCPILKNNNNNWCHMRVENENKLPSYHCFREKSVCPIAFCTGPNPPINIDWSLILLWMNLGGVY